MRYAGNTEEEKGLGEKDLRRALKDELRFAGQEERKGPSNQEIVLARHGEVKDFAVGGVWTCDREWCEVRLGK